MNNKILNLAALAVLLVPFETQATPMPVTQATPTLITEAGQLTGANNVNVGGTLYNVMFGEDTCIALFDGCDAVSDFVFQTEADAIMASQALLDQVLVDFAVSGTPGDFDLFPALTLGCENQGYCAILTPYGFQDDSGHLLTQWATNTDQDDWVEFIGWPWPEWTSCCGSTNETYAVWTAVPEPATFALLSLGLCGLGFSRRKKL